MAFQLGNAQQQQSQQPTQQTGGFTFGGFSTPTTQTGGIFGSGAANPIFGSAVTTTSASTTLGGGIFGQAKPFGGFSFGGGAVSAAPAATALPFGAAAPMVQQTPSAPATSSTGFTFGSSLFGQPAGASVAPTPPATTTAAPSALNLTFGAARPSTTTSASLFGAPPVGGIFATPAAGGIATVGATTTAASASPFSFAPQAGGSGGFSFGSTATAPATVAPVVTAASQQSSIFGGSSTFPAAATTTASQLGGLFSGLNAPARTTAVAIGSQPPAGIGGFSNSSIFGSGSLVPSNTTAGTTTGTFFGSVVTTTGPTLSSFLSSSASAPVLAPASTATPPLQFGATSAVPAATQSASPFQAQTTTPATSAATLPGFGFPASSATTGSVFPSLQTSSAATNAGALFSQPSLGSSVAPVVQPSLASASLLSAASTAPTSQPSIFGAAKTAAAPTLGFNLSSAVTGTSTVATSLPLPSIGLPSSTISTSGFGVAPLGTFAAGTSAAISTGTAPLVTAAAATSGISQQLTYHQLEDLLNRWTTDLEEQERLFLQQATQVNAWDRILIENNDKISKLFQHLNGVQQQHAALESEIDYIASKQTDLKQDIEELEKKLASDDASAIDGGFSFGGSFAEHADAQRDQILFMAVSTDSQMKQLSQDLSEVMEKLNISQGGTKGDANDSLKQISMILTKQMETLQWIDENTSKCFSVVQPVRLDLLEQELRNISTLSETSKKSASKPF